MTMPQRSAVDVGGRLSGTRRSAQLDKLSQAPAAQQPDWARHPDLACIRAELADLPALVALPEIQALRTALGRVEDGQAHLLHIGECAETFEMSEGANVERRLSLYRRLADHLADRTGREVVLVARLAGQHAKPRSEATEALADGSRIPVYRGDAVNSAERAAHARHADPWRMLSSYDRSLDTLRHLRAQPGPGRCAFVSHEALLRDYEEPLTRGGTQLYATSGHLLWIGERTRGPGDWHVQWAASLANPLGLKLGPTATAAEAAGLAGMLNPLKERGRLSLIARMGAAGAADRLRALTRAVADSGTPVLWQCDPMHGNTRKSAGVKLRLLPEIRAEIRAFTRTLAEAGVHRGGLHLEVTPDLVAECHEELSGASDRGPRPPCDPRLNPGQALEIVDYFATETARLQ
jgi:3-deoxy-7-phosphoheptulonate synthase